LGYSSTFGKLLPGLVAESDIVHIHCLWQFAGWMASREARKQGKPYVVMPHGFLEPERLKVSRWKKRIMGTFIDRPMLDHAAAVIATSESEADGIRQYGVKRPIHIMPIGLDIEKYKMSSCEGKTLLYFSRITPIKGLDMLAEVWGQIDRRGWKLLIVGPDDRGYTDEMKRLFARRCPAESYEFRSPVFGEEKYRLLSSVDAFVLPTRSENWSIAVAEAMVSGLPVVCTKGAPWRCLDEVKAGWWVDISEDGLRQGLSEMMKLTPEERIAWGQRGRKWCEQHLSWGQIAENMRSCYSRCLQRCYD
jgi:glycosyltransferase involved in cell wall biosynthesis